MQSNWLNEPGGVNPPNIRDDDMGTEETEGQVITAIKKVTKNGHSLTLNLTREMRLIGLERGDEVIVILKKRVAE